MLAAAAPPPPPPRPEEKAFWMDVCVVREMMQHTEHAMQQLEQRQQQRSAQLDDSFQRSMRRMMQVVMRAWFESRYCLPGPYTVRPVRVTRGDLLSQLNHFLQQLELPPVQKRDALWSTWFLKEVLQMDDQERATGKTVQLDQRCSLAVLQQLAANTQNYLAVVQQSTEEED
jgi:hypothetical protein